MGVMLKLVLLTECILILLDIRVTANEQIGNSELFPVISSEHGDNHFFFIPLDKKYDNNQNDISPLQAVRRNDFFYAKNLKTLPRIGRRNDFFLKAASGAKSVPRIGRRDEYVVGDHRELTSSWPWYRSDNFIPRVVKKNE